MNGVGLPISALSSILLEPSLFSPMCGENHRQHRSASLIPAFSTPSS